MVQGNIGTKGEGDSGWTGQDPSQGYGEKTQWQQQQSYAPQQQQQTYGQAPANQHYAPAAPQPPSGNAYQYRDLGQAARDQKTPAPNSNYSSAPPPMYAPAAPAEPQAGYAPSGTGYA